MIQSVNPANGRNRRPTNAPHRIWAVVGISFALCMSVLDINIINVVLPTLSHDFGTSPAVTTWIINGYQLAIVISLSFFRLWGDYRLSKSISFGDSYVICVTSLICALSHSFWTLTIARIFQGFSASAITSVNTAQLRTIYPRRQIGRGMGINAMVVAISAAAGPSVASGILSIASWHWLFAINVPLGITALVLGIKYLPRQEERTNRKFDKLSAIANAITFGLLIYTLDGFAHHEKMDFLFIQLIVVLAVVGTYYVRRQLNQPSPLLPLDLLRIPIFRLSILTSICSFTAQMSAMVSLPFLPAKLFGIQRGHDRAIVNSLAYSDTRDCSGSGIPGGTHSSGNTRQHRDGIVCIGLYSLSTLTADSSVTGIILRLMLCGAGFGLFQTPNNSTIISSAPTTFGRSKRNAGYGTALGTDIRYDTGCFALQFCSTREEYGGLSDSRQRICVCRSSGKQHAAFTTLHIKDEAPITISIHVYRPTGSQSNTK